MRSPRTGNSGCLVTSNAGAIRARLPIRRNSTKTSGGTWPSASFISGQLPAHEMMITPRYTKATPGNPGFLRDTGLLAVASSEALCRSATAALPSRRTRHSSGSVSCVLPLKGGENRLEPVHLISVGRERHQDRGCDTGVAPLLDPFADAGRRAVQSAIGQPAIGQICG